MGSDLSGLAWGRLLDGWPGRADAYDAWLAAPLRRLTTAVVERCDVRPGARFLDVVCGTGAFAIAAAQAGADVLATDPAPSMVSAARGNLAAAGAPGRAEVMDPQALDLPDGSFDTAGSFLGWMFLPDPAAGVGELHRVLRAGGRAVLVTWTPEGFTAQRLALQALAAVAPEVRSLPLEAVYRLADADALARLLTGAGFAPAEVVELPGAWPIHQPASLFESIPSWSAPFRPIFERLHLDLGRLHAAADVLAGLVREHSTEEGLPMPMLVATGTR